MRALGRDATTPSGAGLEDGEDGLARLKDGRHNALAALAPQFRN